MPPDRATKAGDGDEDVLADLSHATPKYRRALWIVAVLNLGYGVVEAVAGFVGSSQALKADALDFLGDGLITLLAVLATRWSATWRARFAMAEGIFLGALGVGVLASTAYRVLVLGRPDADFMWIFGSAGLIVNVLAALVLARHRTGDANVRAVWLFSRNDAIGNALVVLAGMLVAWTSNSWPDLLASALIAGLFLKSAWSIVAVARTELRAARPNMRT
jgi:Co/Zn/Cd efflux system component